MDKQIFDKIQKLLNLGNGSGFKGESDMALKKAYDLMAQYNVSMKDLEQNTLENTLGKLGIHAHDDLKKYYKWELQIASYLSDLFNCRIVLNCVGNKKRVKIIGREGNATTVKLMFDWITTKTKNEVKDYFKYDRDYWNSYCAGVAVSIRDTVKRLKDLEQAENRGEWGLVLVDEATQFLNDHFKNLGETKTSVNVKDARGFMKGKDVGSKISLNRQFGLQAIAE